MDEDVLISSIGADETVALDAAEPFDSARYSSAHIRGSSLNPSDKKNEAGCLPAAAQQKTPDRKIPAGEFSLAASAYKHIAEHRPQNLAREYHDLYEASNESAFRALGSGLQQV